MPRALQFARPAPAPPPLIARTTTEVNRSWPGAIGDAMRTHNGALVSSVAGTMATLHKSHDALKMAIRKNEAEELELSTIVGKLAFRKADLERAVADHTAELKSLHSLQDQCVMGGGGRCCCCCYEYCARCSPAAAAAVTPTGRVYSPEATARARPAAATLRRYSLRYAATTN